MDAFVSALQPIETAQGLPNSCYTDPAMFQIEKKQPRSKPDGLSLSRNYISAAMWKDVLIEDIAVLEGMQAGRMAPSYDGRKFSAVMDFPTHHFYKWVAQRLIQTG